MELQLKLCERISCDQYFGYRRHDPEWEMLHANNHRNGSTKTHKGTPQIKKLEVTPDMMKEPIIEKEALEFLKFIKYSEYNVVEQLNKLHARISLLALLLNFEPHSKALMLVLSEAYIAQNILMEKVD